MHKDAYFYLTLAVGVLIIALGAYVMLNIGPLSTYKYSVEKKGVEFVSNDAPPADMLEEIKASGAFIVSPAFVEQGPENSYMTGSLTLFNTVLTAKQKRITVVARITGEKGAIVGCQSNLGDVKQNTDLSVAACMAAIGDSSSARVFIELPGEKLQRPRVVLEKGVIRVYPSSFEGVSDVSFIVLENMYPDAKSIVDRVNAVVARA